MILLTESEEAIRSLPDHHALSDRIMGENNEKPQWKWHMKGVWATNFICHLIFGGHLLNIPIYFLPHSKESFPCFQGSCQIKNMLVFCPAQISRYENQLVTYSLEKLLFVGINDCMAE